MSLPDFFLEASRVLIGLGLAVFIGVPLAFLVGRKKKIFSQGKEEQGKGAPGILLEGEEGEGQRERLARAKFVAAGALLLGVLLEAQVMGSSLPARHVWRAGVIFLLLATLVSAVMIVLPWERYYREKSLTFEENLRPTWVSRADAARGRAARLDFFGFLLALAALVLG
jgi:hypothetical protein